MTPSEVVLDLCEGWRSASPCCPTPESPVAANYLQLDSSRCPGMYVSMRFYYYPITTPSHHIPGELFHTQNSFFVHEPACVCAAHIVGWQAVPSAEILCAGQQHMDASGAS